MKQKTLIIVTLGFLSTLFGCGQSNKTVNKDIFPIESFSVIEGEIGDKPVIGSFNIAYKTYDKTHLSKTFSPAQKSSTLTRISSVKI